MALTAGTIWEIRASATTGNVNGAGFNPANAAAVTDLTTDANTANTNSPVCSSATYTFVAGDVNAWLYIVSGTNWTPGWYQIASVSAGKATLSAAVGQAIQRDTTLLPHKYYTNTVAGCATVGTPTSGTFLIDYSQQDTTQYGVSTATTSGAGSTTLTVSSGSFTRMMVGNLLYIASGTNFQTGWYEIATFTDASNVVLDRTPTSGGAGSNGVIKVGGAGRWNALEDAQLEAIPGSSFVHVKNGSYTISGSISISSSNSTNNSRSNIQGYNSVRGDVCNESNRPVITCAANTIGLGQWVDLTNFKITGTGTPVLTPGTSAIVNNVSVFCTSSTASRTAITLGTTNVLTVVEACSLNGTAINANSTGRLTGVYVHDSVSGITTNGNNLVMNNIIVQACKTVGISWTSSSGTSTGYLSNATIYGNSGKNCTNGLYHNSASLTTDYVTNTIFSGWTTGHNQSATNQTNRESFCNFYNNTTDVTNVSKSPTDLALNPSFTDVAEISGTTATTSGSVLTQSGGDFSTVEDNVDVLRVLSGTGVTTGGYLITSHTATTLTVNNALGTSSAGDVNYFIPTGHDFSIGTNLKAAGIMGAYPGSATTGYMDIGAVQRQATSGSSGGSYAFS